MVDMSLEEQRYRLECLAPLVPRMPLGAFLHRQNMVPRMLLGASYTIVRVWYHFYSYYRQNMVPRMPLGAFLYRQNMVPRTPLGASYTIVRVWYMFIHTIVRTWYHECPLGHFYIVRTWFHECSLGHLILSSESGGLRNHTWKYSTFYIKRLRQQCLGWGRLAA